AVLPPGTAARVPEEARRPLLKAADRLLQEERETLGAPPTDLERPDWFGDREPSRPQHLTLLATAWFLTQDERYACRVADHLRRLWRENPFLSGAHCASGISLGTRLISLVWIRR